MTHGAFAQSTKGQWLHSGAATARVFQSTGNNLVNQGWGARLGLGSEFFVADRLSVGGGLEGFLSRTSAQTPFDDDMEDSFRKTGVQLSLHTRHLYSFG